MRDADDPPRKHYGFKAREFERANLPPAAASAPPDPTRDGAGGLAAEPTSRADEEAASGEETPGGAQADATAGSRGETQDAPPAAGAAPLPVDPGVQPPGGGPIDVRDLARIAAGSGPQLGQHAPVNRPGQVHAVLAENFQRDVAAGRFELGALDDSKRRRRLVFYWTTIVGVNVGGGLFAWWVGPGEPLPFVCAISGMALVTSYLTWETFFLRTHY